MTKLEKRLKHIEETNNKRTDNYIKQQKQAENNYKIQVKRQEEQARRQQEANTKLNIIANGNRDSFMTPKKLANARSEFAKKTEINQNKYLNANLEKETKKATNSNVTLQNTNLNNYNKVKNTADNYVSQRNRNDENVRVFTKERNQAKSNQIVNNIYGKAGQQADEDKYNDTIDSLNKQKETLEREYKKNIRSYSETKKLQSRIDEIEKQIDGTKKQYNDNIYQRDKSSIYANNGTVTNTLQDYTFATEGAKMKGSLTSNKTENAKLEALRKSWEDSNKQETEATKYNLEQKKNNLQSQLETIKNEFENEYPDDYRRYQLETVDVSDYVVGAKVTKNFNAVNYSKGAVNLLKKYAELQAELEELDSADSKVSMRKKRGAELASEDIEDNEETRLAIRAGIEDTNDDDEDFQKLLSQYVQEEDRIRYYYIKGKYGSEAAKSYSLYAVEQANTSEGLQEAYENNTLEEFHNAASNGLSGFFEGWWDSVDALATTITGKEGVLKSDYTRINSASDVEFQNDKEQAGKVKSFLLDATNTTANQLPSIALSMVTSGIAGGLGVSASAASTAGNVVGMGSLSISAAGNAYSEALMEGKSTDEAFVYGGIQGLMEFATEKLLGGQFGMNGALEKYGSKALENVLPKLIKNETFATYAYQAGKVLINSAGEFNEEAIQQLLEPYIRNIAFGEDNKQTLQNVEDALYSGLLGLASAGMTNTAGEITTGVVNAISNKIQNKKLTNFYDNLIQSESPSQNSTEITNQTEITEAPSVEAIISEAETNKETAKRISKVIDKIDKGETVTNSEIAELKYNKTASNMLEQMAGLKKSKITSALDNDTVREVINEAQNGKKNIDTASMLGNIRSNLNLTQNIAENTNENSSDAVLNADKGKLTGINKNAVESISEPYNASQSNEVGEAMPENIARNAKKNYINNIEADNLTASEETAALNDSPYIENVLNNDSNSYNKVGNDSSKIFKLGISNKKSGMTNIKKVQSIDNGVAQLLMSNGDVVSADTLDFSGNQNAEIILTNAGKYNSNSANTFIANYDSSRSTPQAYSTAFNSVYKMSKAGMSFDAVASEASAARGILGEDAFNAAIRAGRNTAKGVFSDRTGSNAKNTAKTKTTDEVSRTDKSASKLITSSAEKNISQNNNTVKTNKIDVKKSAKEMSKALGVKINVYKSNTYVRGYEKNGEIFINESWVNKKANSASEFNYIFAHELTHTLEESSYYNQLKSFILNSRIYDDSLKLRDTTHTEEIRTRQELYEKEGKKLTKEQAERELIADFIADELLTNEECIKELAYKDKKLFVKIKEFLNKMIDTLKRFVKNSGDITQAQKDLIHIKQLYNKAFKDVKKNGTYSNEIKYSKKLGGYNPDIKVTTDNVLEEYGIKNINRKYEVYNKVSKKLSKSYLSTNEIHKPITNIDTGLKIEIRKSGINETFGNPKYYDNLTKDLKLAKIASMSELAKMIKYGEVRAKDSSNYHDPKSKVRFSYLKSSINIDGVNYDVTMDIKRLPNNDNIFYIHALKIKKQETNSLRRTANALKENLPLANNNISQNDDIVNNSILKNADSDTKFSIAPEFESKYDNWDKKKSNFSFKIGTTSEALKSIGVKDSTIVWDASKIIKIKKDHPQMTDSVIKQVPNVLENPIIIMESTTVQGRLTLFGEVYDAENNPVLAVLELNPVSAKGKSLNLIKIASAYGKDTNPQGLINKSKIVYIEPNKKRTNNWLKLNRLQLPLVNQSGSNNSITKTNNTVNTNILENSDNDTKFSLDDDLKNLNEKYGTKKKGENPVRDIDVPEKSSDNKRVREFVKTILESGALTDEMVNEVSDELVKDTLSYEPMSNENVLRVANEWLDNNGKGVTEKHWSDWDVISNGRHRVTALDIAKGELLLKSAAQNNDTQKVLKLTAEISEMAAVAGQTVQATRLLKKSTGLGQLYYAEKTVRRMNIDYETKYAKKGKKAPQIKINEDLALELAQAKTETQKEVAADKLYKDIGKQVPANWVDKWNAWRYMCMLTNPTTHIRNVVGNGIFMPAVACKNAIGYGLETVFLRNGQEKTKAIKVKGEYKAFAEQDFDNVVAELTGNGKYEPTDMIQSNKIIFKTKWLEGLRNLNGNFLEAEDAIFLKHHYKRALSMYLQANKIALNELSDIKAENARKAAIDKGRIYAIKEAQKATYRDASKLADAISQFSKSHKAAGVVIEGVIPFKKTPINVAKRAVEYSPAGLIKSLSWNSYQLYQGDITVAEYIDNISAGITGTGLVALGLFLGHLGAIKVGLGDDDKEQGLEKLEGHQEYSIELFGYSYTFDWACPAAIPIFIGAKAGEMLNEENEGLTVADYEDLTTTMLDPMFEMSVLSGIDNMIQNVKYSESPVVDTGLYAVSSYLGQGVPTLGGKIAGTIDGTRRSSYIDKSKDTFVSKNFTSSQQQFVNKIVKKIPGATYLLEPYVNEWGEQEKQDNVGVRIFQNFISPGYISKIEVDEVEKMLEDTYKESGNSTVLPTKSKKYFSVNGDTVHLTADEYTTYATVRGQMAHSILKDLSNNSDFKSAESADKASLISKAYELSNAIAKQGVSDYEPDGWIKKATEANERGMSYSDFLVMRERLNEISGEGTKEKRYNKIRRMNISKSAKEALWKSFNYDMALGGESINFY